jgi:hypothetical protein
MSLSSESESSSYLLRLADPPCGMVLACFGDIFVCNWGGVKECVCNFVVSASQLRRRAGEVRFVSLVYASDRGWWYITTLARVT